MIMAGSSVASSPLTTTLLSSCRLPALSSSAVCTLSRHCFWRQYRWAARVQSLDFPASFFEDKEGGGNTVEDNDGPTSAASAVSVVTAVDGENEPQCPPGLRKYESMVVLRPDMSEDERIAFTQKYVELLVAGGAMYEEVFNRGVIPLAYSIKKKNKAGETNTYMDGIYLLFTYFTKPESMSNLESRLKADDDVIRSSSFKIRKRKY